MGSLAAEREHRAREVLVILCIVLVRQETSLGRKSGQASNKGLESAMRIWDMPFTGVAHAYQPNVL